MYVTVQDGGGPLLAQHRVAQAMQLAVRQVARPALVQGLVALGAPVVLYVWPVAEKTSYIARRERKNTWIPCLRL